MNPDVLVIGAGLGGLSCAVELARQGMKVRLIEAAALPGGCLRTFRKRGFHFHLSPQYIGALQPGGATDAVLASLGVRDRIKLQRPPLFLTAEFPGLELQLPNQREGLLEVLTSTFPRERDGIRSLFAAVEDLAAVVAHSSLFPGDDPERWRGKLDAWRGRTFQALLAEHVVDPRLQAVLGQTWMNMGLPPSQVAAPFAAAVFASGWIEGVNTIVGGGTALVRAMMERLLELGGECWLSCPVDRVIVGRAGVQGVLLRDGRSVDCPLVVSAVDPYQLFFELIPGPEVSRLFRFRLERMEPSVSMYALHLGLDCPPSQLGIAGSTTFVNTQVDHDEAFRRAVEGELQHSSWRMTSYQGSHEECAPPTGGIVAMTEVTPAGSWLEIDDPTAAELEAGVLETLLAKAEARYPGLAEHTVQRDLATPRSLHQRFGAHQGAAYGLAQTVEQSGARRLGVRAPVAGLFLAGAWARAGGGVEATLLGGIQAASAAVVFAGRKPRAGAPKLRRQAEPTPDPPREPEGLRWPEESPALREHFSHRYPVLVYGCDLNARGYADAEAYLRFVDRARTELIEALCQARGEPSWHETHMVNVYRVQARFQTTARVGTALEVRTGLCGISSHRGAFHQRIVRQHDEALLFDGRVEVTFLDHQGQMVPVPPAMPGADQPVPSLNVGFRLLPFTERDHFPFHSPTRVHFEDTDLQRITFHVSYMRFAERALFDLVRTVWPNLGVQDWMERFRVSVCGLDLRFLRPTRLGDRLSIQTGVLGLDGKLLHFGQRFVLADNDELVADLVTTVEFRDERERVIDIPRQAADIARANLLRSGR
jgi:YbgC/YbaW family acyl-CoA thioester hydrolase